MDKGRRTTGHARQADLICFSPQRWSSMDHRPQHLMRRAARERRVTFFEEPVFEPCRAPSLALRREGNLTIAAPHLPEDTSTAARPQIQRWLLDVLLERQEPGGYDLWYATPLALPFTRHLRPRLTIYDCMDELSVFAGAPAELPHLEAELLRRADLVFTSGREPHGGAHGHRHHNQHAIPSSVDPEHFAKARGPMDEPEDQRALPRPRAGFLGVIDERVDLALVARLAAARPDLQIVMLGPLVGQGPARLPRAPNLLWASARSYAELPSYLAGWQVALLPLVRDASPRSSSPAHVLEYLAAGLPVVSTSLPGVVRPYGEARLVTLADDVPAFAAAVDAALGLDRAAVMRRADAFLAWTSWDRTWARIQDLMERTYGVRSAAEIDAVFRLKLVRA